MRSLIPHWMLALALALVACAFQEPADRSGATPSPPQAAEADLTRERALLSESEAARNASDYATARAKAAEAVTSLLAWPESEQGEAWLELLDSAGQSSWYAQDPGTARRAYERVLAVCSRTLPDDHHDLQAARQKLAVTLYSLGDLEGAHALLEKVLDVRSRTLPDDHHDLQSARVNLAGTLCALGDLPAARALLEQVLEVRLRTLPADHPDLQGARLNLAGTLYSLGDLPAARALYEQALEVSSRTLPVDHPDLQAARQGLALTLAAQGDLQGARALEEKVLEVRSRTLPDVHPDLQGAQLNLARTLLSLGDFPGARALFEQVLEVRSRTLPDEHPDLQKARQGLAATLLSLGDLKGAHALFEQALEVCSRTLPDEHPDLQGARQNLALTLEAQGDLQGARALEEKALEVCSRTLPDEHPDLQAVRQNLALTLKAQGDLQGARALEEKVLEVRSRTLPDDHPDLQGARQNLAATIAAQAVRDTGGPKGAGKKAEGERCAELIGARCRSQVAAARAALLAGSRREAEERCAQLSKSLDQGLSFAQGYGIFGPLPALERDSFALGETTRGAALASARVQRLAAGSARYAGLCADLRRESAGLAALAQQGTTSAEFRAVIARREGLERELVSLAKAELGAGGLVLDVGAEELGARLGEREALVGFHRYMRWTVEAGDALDATGERAVIGRSSASLCALVLRAGAAAEAGATPAAVLTRVELGPIEPVESAVRAWRDAIGAELERGVGVVSGSADVARTRGSELRRLVVDPLLPALEGVEHVVLALDDVLHLVPIDALPLDEEQAGAGGMLAGDRWRIETRCTLSELLAPAPVPSSGEVLVALGGASFNSEPMALDAEDVAVIEAANPTEVAAAMILRGSRWERGFGPLTYTGLEAREIAALHEEVFEGRGSALVLEKRKASRASLEELAPGARWLHVATHGWFASESIRSWSDPEPIDVKSGLGLRLSGEEEIKGMSPMLLCGLALAGANLSEDELGRVPGLMTAEELASLDLSRCELAVLSACDTNVGERRAGQGVASLQRALQMAGARSVITSLWKVPDEATRELMSDFYRRLWVEKKPKWQALWEAKKKLCEARDERGQLRYSTRDWAAWVLTGEQN